ncbi:alpha/beta hydrolase [Brevibacterium samyangense]|uniref:Alpha/beta hydrolase n=1 Tax=Brevibacterium samyangense TaxID=366888 RepID=A0ABP5F1J9_9MICO
MSSSEPVSAQGTPVRRDPNRPGPDTHYLSSFGSGDPVTVFAHGFSGAIRDTRPFASGIAGTRVLVNLGGHGGRPSPGPDWTYTTVATQLADALERSRATRALGVSMSAGGLARLVTDRHPSAGSLERIAFVLPASWAGFPAQDAERNAAYTRTVRARLAAGDREGLLADLLAREPANVAELPPAVSWARAKVDALFDTDMVDGAGLSECVAVEDPAAAADFAGEVLVLTQEDDAAHPVEIARAYASAFANAHLEVLPAGSILWHGRSRVREILTAFFDG